jgi:hypothetical protein
VLSFKPPGIPKSILSPVSRKPFSVRTAREPSLYVQVDSGTAASLKYIYLYLSILTEINVWPRAESSTGSSAAVLVLAPHSGFLHFVHLAVYKHKHVL